MRHETCCLTGLLMAEAHHLSTFEGANGAGFYDELCALIRENNLSELERRAGEIAPGLALNPIGNTPLHYAALYGSAESVRILLAAGMDVNAKNSQSTTPLFYAAYDRIKTGLLVEKGAYVNAANQMGQTPLIAAASAQRNADTVSYLLENGADPASANRVGNDALMNAAAFSDVTTVRTLLAHGADAGAKNTGGGNALMNAVSLPDDGRIDLLLAAGADVNAVSTFAGTAKNGPLALVQLTALLLAAPYAEPNAITALLAAGANVNHVDVHDRSPLMQAVSTDFARVETIKRLLAAGADVNAKDEDGASVLDWAQKFGNREIVTALTGAGALFSRRPVDPPERPVGLRVSRACEALDRSCALLVKASQVFSSEGDGCWSCHHQPMEARVYSAVREAGLPADERLRSLLRDALAAGHARAMTLSTVLVDMGGDFNTMLSPLAAMADLREAASADTDTLIHYLATRQQPSGAWHAGGIARMPLEDSDISRTALALRALKTYGWPARRREFDERIERGVAWLLQAQPMTNYERADLLMGLFYAQASSADIRKAAACLLRQQNLDGGWAQTEHLSPDAYATGMALHALHIAGMLRAGDEAYRRGVAYLLRTQFPDGSWYVPSRAPRCQPNFRSGFPFGDNEWISRVATGWAAMALAPAAALEVQAGLFARMPVDSAASAGGSCLSVWSPRAETRSAVRRITVHRKEVVR